MHHVTEYSQLKLWTIWEIWTNFENRAHCKNYLTNNKHNSLHLVQKYALLFVLGFICSSKPTVFCKQIMSADKQLSKNIAGGKLWASGNRLCPRTKFEICNIWAYFHVKWKILFISHLWSSCPIPKLIEQTTCPSTNMHCQSEDAVNAMWCHCSSLMQGPFMNL